MKTQEGFVLPAVIFALAIMGLLSVVSLRTADDERRSSRALRESGAALYAADAGLNKVWATWDSAAAKTVALGDSLAPVWDTLSNGATYQAVTQRVGNQLFIVRVAGRGAGPFGGRRSLTVMVAIKSIFQWAAFGRDDMSIGGGSVIGPVGSNGDLSIQGGGFVSGDATLGGTVNDPTKVGGILTEGQPQVTLSVVECPSTGYGPPPIGSTFNPVTGDVNVTTNTPMTFPGGTYYFHDFSKAGGADLIIPVGESVQIYLSGQMQMTGNGFVNLNNDAEFLQIWGCGNDTSNWSIGGSATAYMTVFAPNHDLILKGSGDKFGSFTGATLTKQGNGSVTYDANLEDNLQGPAVRVPGSWMQLN